MEHTFALTIRRVCADTVPTFPIVSTKLQSSFQKPVNLQLHLGAFWKGHANYSRLNYGIFKMPQNGHKLQRTLFLTLLF